jgi:hypothetical protein
LVIIAQLVLMVGFDGHIVGTGQKKRIASADRAQLKYS